MNDAIEAAVVEIQRLAAADIGRIFNEREKLADILRKHAAPVLKRWQLLEDRLEAVRNYCDSIQRDPRKSPSEVALAAIIKVLTAPWDAR